MPSSDRRVEQCTSHVAIVHVSFTILYFTRFMRGVAERSAPGFAVSSDGGVDPGRRELSGQRIARADRRGW
eukprot:3475530-Prymnesium_polylepis.1